MSDHNNIYNIMGKLNALTPAQEAPKETKQIYESVEAKGSVLEGVKKVQANLEAKLAEHKMTEDTCNECGMYESSCECDHEHTNEERETLKTKKGTIYKGGKYGTEYDGSGDGEKKKPKAKDGEKKGRGRPKKEEPAKIDAPKGDIFGRTTGSVPKGKKGTVVKGKANQDTVDEEVTVDKLEKSYTKHMDRAEAGGGDKERKRAVKTLYVGGADAAEKAYDQYHQKKYGTKPTRESAPKGWEGTVKAMKKHKEIDNPYALTNYMKNKGYKSHVKESTMGVGKALMESVNFRKMVDEADMTADEMLECINQDIQAYKATGDMTTRLRDFMHLHNHMKKMQETVVDPMSRQMPSGQDILPQQSTLGKIGSTVKKAFTGPDDAELLARLQQDTQAPTTVDEELNELAKLAGITDEGNAFTGKLASTPKGGKFELDGEEFTDTSNVDEGGIEGRLSRDGSMMKFDGEEEPETVDIVAVAEGKKTGLADIAKLSGIFQEGKDYGDTTFNEPPHYDNSPDEEVMGVEVLTKGGDGEVAGMEKKMHNDKPTFKNADNALSETKDMLKPAAEFNFVKEMGRDLMKAYQGIKTK